jgi:flagellar basal body-associated protein FliL
MNTKYIVAVAAMAAMLVAATALATDSAFATKKRHRSESQAAAQTNDCGNGFQPFDVFCQNLASQIQGDGNAAALTGEQGEEED